MKKYDFDFQAIVEAAKDVIIVTKASPIVSPGPEIVYVNKAFTELTGYSYEEAVGKNPRILQSAETDDTTKARIRAALENKTSIRTTIKNYSKSGKEYWLDISILPLQNSAGEVTHFVAIERDVTEQKKYEFKLDDLSKTDPLTGLLNRRGFDDIVSNELSRFKRTKSRFSICMIDADYFKKINDTYGHAFGDLVLKTLSDTFRNILRAQDSAARIGGEEFCIIFPDTSAESATHISNRLRNIVSKTPIFFDSTPVYINISVGVSEIDNMDVDGEKIVERADKALYLAKVSGRNKVCVEVINSKVK